MVLSPFAASMQPLLGEYEKPLSLVREYFDFQEHYIREEGTIELEVPVLPDIKQRFYQLARRMRELGWRPVLERGTKEDRLTMHLVRFPSPRPRFTPTHLSLLAVTIAFCLAQGYYRSSALPFAGDRFLGALYYAAALLGIIGVHEMGHMLLWRHHGYPVSYPYFLPGIPIYTIVPTFGAVIVVREPFINRDTMFDVAVAGPLAGLGMALIVSLPGALTSQLILPGQVPGIPLGVSPLQYLVFSLTGMLRSGYEVLLSPLGEVAWLGFLVTFLNLLPATQLDGGHLARAALGRRLHQIASYVVLLVTLYLGYWPFALFILYMLLSRIDVRPLDDVSPLSRGRKLLWASMMVLMALTAPIIS
jgi:Zn-dependent protease